MTIDFRFSLPVQNAHFKSHIWCDLCVTIAVRRQNYRAFGVLKAASGKEIFTYDNFYYNCQSLTLNSDNITSVCLVGKMV